MMQNGRITAAAVPTAIKLLLLLLPLMLLLLLLPNYHITVLLITLLHIFNLQVLLN